MLLIQGPGSALFAQQSNSGSDWDNVRSRSQGLQSDSIRLDSLSVWPSSLQIWSIDKDGYHSLLQHSVDYRLRPASGWLLFYDRPDSVKISYRVLPIDLDARFRHKGDAPSDSLYLRVPLEYIPDRTESREFLELGGLDYNGSFSRGLSFGNQQDVVVNSSLNLQLSGEIGDGITIEAAISDNNIPVQPEGNTQQLQEFDQVYIRLRKDPHQLQVGDFQLQRPESWFMNTFKRLQGGMYSGRFGNLSPKMGDRFGSIGVTASAAVARGQYRRQTIIPLEGEQGPYRLTGNNGERFIIVLAGSERVFVDGRQLVRGQERDYVIDYNAAELIFTPNLLVTKDIRIQIEFEYSDRNYFRSIAYGHVDYQSPGERWEVNLDVYSEQDGKNQPVDQELGPAEREALRAAGDGTAFVSGADSVGFDPSRILYRVTDSLGVDSVFVYSTDPDQAFYSVLFAEVGPNGGDYVLDPEAVANGRVYSWIAPVAGLPQGNYAPIRVLVPPSTHQLITLGSKLKVGEQGLISVEGAFSREDPNTFSEIDDQNDAGTAARIAWVQELELGNSQVDSNGSTQWSLIGQANYEFVDERFRFLERYRPIEFERDWNASGLNSTTAAEAADEHLLNATIGFARRDDKSRDDRRISYGLSRFQRGTIYEGNRQEFDFLFRQGGLRITAGGSWLSSNTDSTTADFIRPRGEVTQRLPRLFPKEGRSRKNGWLVGVSGLGEDNRSANINADDSLTLTSYAFDEIRAFIQGPDSARNIYRFEYMRRRDRAPLGQALKVADFSHNFEATGTLGSLKNQRLNWTASYRSLIVRDTALSRAEQEEAVLGRVEYSWSASKGLLRGDLLYELGTAREPKRDFAYIEVQPGEGQYSWNDYDEDGIAELDEFELAVFADQANYIRVFSPTEEFVAATGLGFRYSLGFEPRAKWSGSEGFAGFLSRFSAQSSWQLNRRLLEGVGSAAYAPIGAEFADSSLVSLSSAWRHNIWFDRGKPGFATEYSFTDSRSVVLIANGAEDRQRREHRIETRARISREWNVRFEAAQGNRSLASAAFEGRDYALPFYEIAPKLSFQSGTKYRITGRYVWEISNNTEGAEQLRAHEAGLEARYNRVGRSTIDLDLSAVIVDFEGEADSPVGFAMLEGLQDGFNLLWKLGIDRRLSRFVQLTLSYEGRKTGDNPTNHVGRAQLRAIF